MELDLIILFMKLFWNVFRIRQISRGGFCRFFIFCRSHSNHVTFSKRVVDKSVQCQKTNGFSPNLLTDIFGIGE